MFGNLGLLELSIVALILLLLFGAKRIPTLFGSIGTGLRELKRSFAGEAEGGQGPSGDARMDGSHRPK